MFVATSSRGAGRALAQAGASKDEVACSVFVAILRGSLRRDGKMPDDATSKQAKVGRIAG